MIEVVAFLASYASASGSAGSSFIDTLKQMGFFDYILPFLLLFALIFGILTKVDLFKNNKIINAIIALAVGLIAIQFPTVSQFFSVIFPKLGIALAIILTILIIAGLFLGDVIGKSKVLNYILLAIAGIIIIVVLANSATSFGLPISQWLSQNWSMIIAVTLIIGIVIAIVVAAYKSSPTTPS